MMMSALYCLLLVVSVVTAQRFQWGLCPKPALKNNFNYTLFQGRWFEHRRLPSLYERGSCNEASIEPVAGETHVVFYQTIEGQVTSSTPTVIRQDAEQPAMLTFSFFYDLIQLSWMVLETDYSTTAMVYYCRDCFNLFHFDLAWLIGRSREAPPPGAAEHVFQRVDVNVSLMLVADQTDCSDHQ